ncbi:uncharacterized protein LOC110751286 [Prunus avium]|uniref:Uncharacterized protein LOC110751286 n=1 Tax=Prunus avium TaxID=42229 RepID=A0A6P5RWD7_PRUAV|nr:uncharacterized protein LOC110751286 [Prunus avium]
MDSLSSVKVLPSAVTNPLRPRRRRLPLPSSSLGSLHNRNLYISSSVIGVPCSPETSSYSRRRLVREVSCRSSGGGGAAPEDADADADADDDGSEQVERALHLDGNIPSTSDEFVKRVSSRAYDMRRHLQQTFDSSSYDVLEANPWRETSKPVYVLTQRENLLCTMKTRRNRSEVETELGKLFSKGSKWNQAKQPRNGTKFQMLVEDIRDGVLVFEDENEAVRYCDLLQGGGQGCEGVAEIEASSVFDLCQKMRALAVLFRRGRSPPLPQSLELNLRARKRSLEDQQDP